MLIAGIIYGKADFHFIAECFLVTPILKLKTTDNCVIEGNLHCCNAHTK